MSAGSGFITGFLAVFRGLAVTLVNLTARRKVTIQYPYEQPKLAPRYRGLFFLSYDSERERLDCTGCTLCAQACPTKVITMTKLGAGKHAGVSEFEMELGKCMFCNLCIEACPFDAIHMGQEFELASYEQGKSYFMIADLAVGGAPSVERNNATIKAALAEEEARKHAQESSEGAREDGQEPV